MRSLGLNRREDGGIAKGVRLAPRCNKGALLNSIGGACKGILYHWRRQLMGWDDYRIWQLNS